MRFLYFIVLPFVGIFASLYGILEPLKATGTIGFKIKYFLKTEESTIFVRRTYAILLLITNILYIIYCILILKDVFDYNRYNMILLYFLVVIVPAFPTILLYFILFNRNGERRR